MSVPCSSPVGGLSRSLAPAPLRWGDDRADAETHFRGCTGKQLRVLRETKSREEHRKAGAKVDLELARVKPAQAETTGEQWAPRGVTAD